MIRFTSRFTPPMTSRADETRSKERHKEKLEVLRVSQFRLTKTVCGKTLPLSIVFFLRSLSIYRRLAVIVRPTITTSAWHSSIAFISNDRSRQRHDTPRRVEPRNCARGSMTTVDRKVQNTLIPGSSTGMAEVQPVEFSFFFFLFFTLKRRPSARVEDLDALGVMRWWDTKRHRGGIRKGVVGRTVGRGWKGLEAAKASPTGTGRSQRKELLALPRRSPVRA